MFFSFEGIDGSGKSTQARLLADALRERGHEVVEVREPGGTELGERVRALLLDPEATIDDRAELLLFSAARAQLVATVVRPALDRGAVVVADRFADSSTAYQGGGRGVAAPAWLESLHAFATANVLPTRTYFVDLPPDEAARRRDNRDADRMESGGLEFYSRVRDAYLLLADDQPQRVLRLDGRRPVQSLADEILGDAVSCLNNESPATRSE